MAGWLEQYADNQDLVVWLNSTIEPNPVYDTTTKRWTVVVIRNGERITMHPSHLVMACGDIGDPNVLKFEGQEEFKGAILHSNTFPGGAIFKGKRVVVIGAGKRTPVILS